MGNTLTAVSVRCIWGQGSSKFRICSYMLLYMSEYPISVCNAQLQIVITICEVLNRSPLLHQATFKPCCCRELARESERLRVRAHWRVRTEDCFAPEQFLQHYFVWKDSVISTQSNEIKSSVSHFILRYPALRNKY